MVPQPSPFIRSIDEAAKRGKIKIESINDYTAEKVEIEIKMPRGAYAQDLEEALYAYTECEVSLSSQMVVIKDNLPIETDVDEILHFNTERLQYYLQRELEIERDNHKEKIFQKTLEQIFIENRLYKKIETIKSYDQIHGTVETSLEPFHKQLFRVPTYDDRERLLNIPIRRISRFDMDKNQEEVAAIEQKLLGTEKELKNIKKYAINYLKELIKTYSKEFLRRTQIREIEQIDKRAIETRTIKVGFDPKAGFVGTKVVSDVSFECTNFDKLLLMYRDGTFKVINIPEKQYVNTNDSKVIFAGVADKKTVFSVAYKDPTTNFCFAKRFVVSKFLIDRPYTFMEEGMDLQYISTQPGESLEILYVPKAHQKIAKGLFELDKVLIKGVSAKGIRIANRQVKKIKVIKPNEKPSKD